MKQKKFIGLALVAAIKQIADVYDKSPYTILTKMQEVLADMSFETLDKYAGVPVQQLQVKLMAEASGSSGENKPVAVAVSGTLADLMSGNMKQVSAENLPPPLQELLCKLSGGAPPVLPPSGADAFIQFLMNKYGKGPESSDSEDTAKGSGKGPKTPKGPKSPPSPPKPIDS